MNSHPSFLRFSKLVLVNIFLVILAGGVVRMTQSGMGCPDWPRCFGKWIPPTNVTQLPANYKEIYAFEYVDTSFNPYHTWIEYINRLLGAILGSLLAVQFFWSLVRWKTNRRIIWLSFALLILTGFQGWLGAKVVQANLEAVKVTTHMLVALMIAALSVTVIWFSSYKGVIKNRRLKNFALLTIILLLVQIVLGTQVREQIDHISADLKFTNRDLWINRLNNIFDIHRSFSAVVAILCIYLFFQYKKYLASHFNIYLILICVLLNILLGIVMTYANIPAVIQPLHLLLSSILVTAVYYVWLRTA
jgi:cytochrome c oxidase assembly protein subunit 15